MAQIDLAGRSIYFFDTGLKADRPESALPLILIHGAAGTHLSWPPQLRRLPGRRVIVPDLPGHGASAGPGCDSVADYARWLLAFMQALEIPCAVLVGHSLGGAIAQFLALEAPDHVAALALIATSARLRVAPDILNVALEHPELAADFVGEHGYGPAVDPAIRAAGHALILATPPQVLLDDYRACDAFDLRERVSGIRAPTLVVMASEDQMTPPRFGAALAESIPGAETLTLQGSGHMIPVERPNELAESLRAWLERRVP